MLDLEDEKIQYPHSLGKTHVLKSCEAVVLKNMDAKSAATLFGRNQKFSSNDEQEYYEYSESEYDSPYEKYNGYNDYDDDTIDIAFDGHPEATWNVD